MKAGVSIPLVTSVKDAITKKEMVHRCQRRTRGVECTGGAIEALFLSFSSATDTLGVPLLKAEMMEIWGAGTPPGLSARSTWCGVELYTTTGHINKGGVRLPVLGCARGSISLESFHLHLARFVPAQQ